MTGPTTPDELNAAPPARPRYDPAQIVADGPFICQRQLHHAIKAMYGATLYTLALAVLTWLEVPHALAAAVLIAGPGLLLVSRMLEWAHPTDRKVRPLWEHAADAITDGALFTIVPAFAAQLPINPLAALITAAVLAGAYFATRHNARP